MDIDGKVRAFFNQLPTMGMEGPALGLWKDLRATSTSKAEQVRIFLGRLSAAINTAASTAASTTVAAAKPAAKPAAADTKDGSQGLKT